MKPILRKHIAEARELDPTLPEAFVAEERLIPGRQFASRIALLERALALHSDNAMLNQAQAFALLTVGRTGNGVDRAKHAAELDPLSPDTSATYILALGAAGRGQTALHELERAEKKWPGTEAILDARWRYHLRYGDPKEALRLIDTGAIAAGEEFRAYLAARIDPSPQNVERAIAEAEAAARDSARAVSWHLQLLAEFRSTEEVFDRLLKRSDWNPDFVSQALFRPSMRNVRRDPRMMQVAKRAGLLDYWTRSGKWPDFCSEPGLPYDCRREAAKLAG